MQTSDPLSPSFNIENLGNPTTVLYDSPVDMSRMVFMLYQDVEQQINRADLKSQITLSTSTILAALAVNLGLGIATQGLAKMSAVQWAAVALYGLCALSFCLAIGFAVAAAYPRAVHHGKKTAAHANLYFSADVIKLQPDDYVARFCAQTNEQLKERVLKQIHIKSQVLEAKLRYVRYGLRSLIAAILWWALAHGTVMFA